MWFWVAPTLGMENANKMQYYQRLLFGVGITFTKGKSSCPVRRMLLRPLF